MYLFFPQEHHLWSIAAQNSLPPLPTRYFHLFTPAFLHCFSCEMKNTLQCLWIRSTTPESCAAWPGYSQAETSTWVFTQQLPLRPCDEEWLSRPGQGAHCVRVAGSLDRGRGRVAWGWHGCCFCFRSSARLMLWKHVLEGLETGESASVSFAVSCSGQHLQLNYFIES